MRQAEVQARAWVWRTYQATDTLTAATSTRESEVSLGSNSPSLQAPNQTAQHGRSRGQGSDQGCLSQSGKEGDTGKGESRCLSLLYFSLRVGSRLYALLQSGSRALAQAGSRAGEKWPQAFARFLDTASCWRCCAVISQASDAATGLRSEQHFVVLCTVHGRPQWTC